MDLQDDCPYREDETVASGLRMDHSTFNGLKTNIEDFLNKTNFKKYNNYNHLKLFLYSIKCNLIIWFAF